MEKGVPDLEGERGSRGGSLDKADEVLGVDREDDLVRRQLCIR